MCDSQPDGSSRNLWPVSQAIYPLKLHMTLRGCVQGMSCFNLLQDMACCPMCQAEVKPVTCAFVGCAWMYDGRKLGPDGARQSSSSSWQVGLLGSSSLPCLPTALDHMFSALV